MLRFNQFIKTIILEAKLEHFVHLNLDHENEHHNELLNAFNNNKEKLVKKHPAQYKDIGDLANAVSPYIKSPEVSGATLIHHNKETGAKVYHVHTDEAACKLSSDTWCTSKGSFGDYDKGRSFIFHFPNEPDRNLRKVGYFGGGQYQETNNFGNIGHNFQDASNKPLSLQNWNTLRKKHNLDIIPDLAGLRGIPISPEEEDRRAKPINDRIKSIIKLSEPYDDIERILHRHDIVPKHIDTILSANNSRLDMIVAGFPQLLKEPHIDTLLERDKNATHKVVSSVLSTAAPHLSNNHIDTLLGFNHDMINYNLSVRPDLSSQHIHHLLDKYSPDSILDKTYFDKNDKGSFSDLIVPALAGRKDLDQSHIKRLKSANKQKINNNLRYNYKI